MRAYKGSGTTEDPYVFFVTDGVKITNTFVNWVLGFNEEGTERISDGYYIRLEIRESNTITGAFIRSIDLDGTVLTDHGYGPGTYWIFRSDTGITKYEEDIPDDEPNIPDGPVRSDGGESDPVPVSTATDCIWRRNGDFLQSVLGEKADSANEKSDCNCHAIWSCYSGNAVSCYHPFSGTGNAGIYHR